MTATAADVVVFGSGLAGCLAALDLSRAGRRTVVVDLAEGAGPAPGHIPSGPTLAYSEAVRRWSREGARELWELQREAHTELRTLLAEWDGDFGYRGTGGFTFAETRAEGLTLADSEDLLREDGFPGEFLDAYMLEARLGVSAFAAAYWAEGEGELDGAALTGAAAAAARASGATFLPVGLEAPEIAREGVRAATAEGMVTAPVAVVTSVALPLAGACGQGKITATRRRGCRYRLPDGHTLPSPARTSSDQAGWTVVRHQLLVEASAEVDPASFVSAHLPEVTGQPEAGGSRQAGTSRDGLPLVGAVPGLPLVLALSGGNDLGYLPLLARWAALLLLTGRDVTPPRLRAARATVEPRGN